MREKLGKKTGILDCGGWEGNRICGENIDQPCDSVDGNTMVNDGNCSIYPMVI